MTAKTREKLNTGYKIAFWNAVALSVFMCAAYSATSVNGTVQNVVSRSQIERKVGTISAAIDGLENTYVSKKEDITMGLAEKLGFKQISNVTFVVTRCRARKLR